MMRAAVRTYDKQYIVVVVRSMSSFQYLHKILMSLAPNAIQISRGVYRLDEYRILKFVVPASAGVASRGLRSLASFVDHHVFDSPLTESEYSSLNDFYINTELNA
jgi:hypothetical protein